MKKIRLLLPAVCLMAFGSAFAQMPRIISYQGVLSDAQGNTLADGEYRLSLNFYGGPDSKTAIWSEEQMVPVRNGLFNVLMGSAQSIPSGLNFNTPIYLGVSINGAPELMPRTMLTASPHAFYALHAGVADGLSPNATGVVTSLNGQWGAVMLQGEGGTTVNQSGNVITISSSGGGGGSGIQGVQNTDGTLAIVSPNGPVATIGVSDGGITTEKLGDGSVKTAKLGDGSVTPAKISTTGASSGEMLGYNGSGIVWVAPPGLLLPYSGSTGSDSTAFRVTTTGNGSAGHFIINNGQSRGTAFVAQTNGSGEAIIGTTSGGGDAVRGITTGPGRAGYFGISNTSNTSVALTALTTGGGNAFVADYSGPNPAAGGGSTTTAMNIAIFKRSAVNKARIDMNGKGYFNGGTQASGADVAEAFEVAGDVTSFEPGDVLAISTTGRRRVEKSSTPYSTLVAGVYATKPGVLLTEREIDDDLSGTVPMGVVGVIPTKVTTENGAIAIGDLLVTSSTPGHAMRADPDVVRPGQVLGKALEGLAEGQEQGVILVLVGLK